MPTMATPMGYFSPKNSCQENFWNGTLHWAFNIFSHLPPLSFCCVAIRFQIRNHFFLNERRHITASGWSKRGVADRFHLVLASPPPMAVVFLPRVHSPALSGDFPKQRLRISPLTGAENSDCLPCSRYPSCHVPPEPATHSPCPLS